MVTRVGGKYAFRVYCRDAEQVFLLGDFNDWSTLATPMRCDDGQTWEIEIPLAPGTYRYGYFIINADPRHIGRDGSCPSRINGITRVQQGSSTLHVPHNN